MALAYVADRSEGPLSILPDRLMKSFIDELLGQDANDRQADGESRFAGRGHAGIVAGGCAGHSRWIGAVADAGGDARCR